jgi:ArsR family metal-binding transcriptional regulator
MSDILSNYITNYVYSSSIIASQDINEEVLLIIKIDKEGFFNLSEIQNSKKVIEVLSDLDDVLQEAIASLPKALPATKTNAGIFVDTQLTLPIQIIALASE